APCGSPSTRKPAPPNTRDSTACLLPRLLHARVISPLPSSYTMGITWRLGQVKAKKRREVAHNQHASRPGRRGGVPRLIFFGLQVHFGQHISLNVAWHRFAVGEFHGVTPLSSGHAR